MIKVLVLPLVLNKFSFYFNKFKTKKLSNVKIYYNISNADKIKQFPILNVCLYDKSDFA